MKTYILIASSSIGLLCDKLVGGFDYPFKALLVVMFIDYLSGILTALMHKSPKTQEGGLSSRVGFRGILKKVLMIMLVISAQTMDALLNMDVLRLAVIYAFIANEILSVIENAVHLNIPIPNILKKAVDMLDEEGKHDPSEVDKHE